MVTTAGTISTLENLSLQLKTNVKEHPQPRAAGYAERCTNGVGANDRKTKVIYSSCERILILREYFCRIVQTKVRRSGKLN